MIIIFGLIYWTWGHDMTSEVNLQALNICFPQHGSMSLISGHLVWQQVPCPTKPSYLPQLVLRLPLTISHRLTQNLQTSYLSLSSPPQHWDYKHTTRPLAFFNVGSGDQTWVSVLTRQVAHEVSFILSPGLNSWLFSASTSWVQGSQACPLYPANKTGFRKHVSAC